MSLSTGGTVLVAMVSSSHLILSFSGRKSSTMEVKMDWASHCPSLVKPSMLLLMEVAHERMEDL